ncbi:15536_t:CDS:2 [Entrophospora sp. SA101]|nr:15536_t:CDS:2 [Entrophospora sp. SA101]
MIVMRSLQEVNLLDNKSITNLSLSILDYDDLYTSTYNHVPHWANISKNIIRKLEYTGQTLTGKDLKNLEVHDIVDLENNFFLEDNDKMDEDMDEESGGDYSDDSN